RDHARFSLTIDVAQVCGQYLAAIRRPLVVREQLGPNVRFTPKSGHWLSVLGCPLCAKSGHSGYFWILLSVGKGAQVRGASPVKLPRRNFLHLAGAAAALPAVSRIARAQTYPSRP